MDPITIAGIITSTIGAWFLAKAQSDEKLREYTSSVNSRSDNLSKQIQDFITNLQTEVERLQEDVKELREENKELRERVATNEAHYKEIIDAREQAINRLRSEYNTTVHEADMLRKQLTTAEEHIVELQAYVAHLRETPEELWGDTNG